MARDIRFLIDDINDLTVQAAREASVRVMNSLAESGPVWTGEFSSAWYALPEGQQPGPPRATGGIYKYDLRNVPRARFSQGKTFYQIVNGASHAGIAMDFEESTFRAVGQPVIPARVQAGRRPGGGRPSLRGDISSGEGRGRRTAPLDWFPNYVQGGGLQRDLSLGASKAFSSTRGRGFAQ